MRNVLLLLRKDIIIPHCRDLRVCVAFCIVATIDCLKTAIVHWRIGAPLPTEDRQFQEFP
jgi:hypothetical protein